MVGVFEAAGTSVVVGSGVLVEVLVGSGVKDGCGLGDGVGVLVGGST